MCPPSPWDKGPPVARAQTPEEIQASAARAAEQKANKLAAAFNFEAKQLAGKVESAISSRGGGVSGNYGADEQYEVGGIYGKAVINQAFEVWKQTYYVGKVHSLNIHKLGPSEKFTGGRDGKLQVNFLRLIVSGKAGKYNIHINAE